MENNSTSVGAITHREVLAGGIAIAAIGMGAGLRAFQFLESTPRCCGMHCAKMVSVVRSSVAEDCFASFDGVIAER